MAGRMTLREVHRRIGESARDGTARPVTLVFFGDSNTRGMAFDPDRTPRPYPTRVLEELRERYAPASFQGINAGIPGDTLHAALTRIEQDVLRHEPDLVVLAFALNDAGAGREGIERFRRDLATALDRIEERAAVILLTPCMMATAVNDRVPMQLVPHAEACVAVQVGGILDEYVAAIRAAGQSRSIPTADAYALWQSLHHTGVDTTRLLANAINHPYGYAHALFALTVLACLEHVAPAEM